MNRFSVSKFLVSALIIISCSLDATLYRLKILEKKQPNNKTQRVVLWSDWHYPGSNKDVCAGQVRDLTQAYDKQAQETSSIALYIEAPKPEYAKLVKDLFELEHALILKAPTVSAKISSGDTSVESMLHDVLSRDMTSASQMALEEQLLLQCAQALSQSPGVLYLDTRQVFNQINDLLGIVYPFPLYKKTTLGSLLNQQLKLFSAFTVDEFFSQIKSMMYTTLKAIEQIIPVTKSLKNREELQAALPVLSALKNLADKAALTYAPYKKQAVFSFFLKRINTAFEELKEQETYVDLHDFVKYVFGEDLYKFMTYTASLSNPKNIKNLLWLLDGPILANIVSSQAPLIAHVIAGEGHINNVAQFLENEGFKVIYDSGFSLKTGDIADDLSELSFRIMLDKATEAEGPIEFEGPTNKELIDYLLPLTREQMQNIFLSSAELAKRPAGYSYKGEL